jgi:hypothetical protein
MMRTIVLLLLGVGASGLARAENGGNFERTLPADPHGIVEISNVSGKVEVIAWDKPQVEVRAELGSGVDRVDVTGEQGRTTIKVIVPNMSFHTINTYLSTPSTPICTSASPGTARSTSQVSVATCLPATCRGRCN